MNTEVKDYLCQLGEAIREDIDESGAVFDDADYLRIVAASEGFAAFIKKIIEEKQQPDDRPLTGKI